MFKENTRSPLFRNNPREKNYHSIGRLKSKRIALPPLHDLPPLQTKLKKSLFSKEVAKTKGNMIPLKKRELQYDDNISPDKNKLGFNKKKRMSRIGIENCYSLKKTNKPQINIVPLEEDDDPKQYYPKRFNSHKKFNSLKLNTITKTEASKKNSSSTKFPVVETNLETNIYLIKDQKINNHARHKFRSEKKLSLNFDFNGIDYATRTRTGEEEKGTQKENNQDSSIILKNVCDIEDYSIYGIMDGHGANGHLVSNFVKTKISEYFNDRKIYKFKKRDNSTEINMIDELYEKLKNKNYDIIKKFYKKTNDELYDTKFDVHFSGTTCVLVFKIGKKIICSNVGDSRAILVERKFIFDEKTNDIINKYEIIELSHDHKPNNKEERERIEKSGGEVDQEYLNENDEKSDLPYRVWKKGCNYPGLAISRCLGDKIAEELGVISIPDIIDIDINKNCKYIIMGSDGVFEYLNNNEIIEVSKKYLNSDNLQKACQIIVEKAAMLFQQKEKRVDDITINIINI